MGNEHFLNETHQHLNVVEHSISWNSRYVLHHPETQHTMCREKKRIEGGTTTFPRLAEKQGSSCAIFTNLYEKSSLEFYMLPTCETGCQNTEDRNKWRSYKLLSSDPNLCLAS